MLYRFQVIGTTGENYGKQRVPFIGQNNLGWIRVAYFDSPHIIPACSSRVSPCNGRLHRTSVTRMRAEREPLSCFGGKTLEINAVGAGDGTSGCCRQTGIVGGGWDEVGWGAEIPGGLQETVPSYWPFISFPFRRSLNPVAEESSVEVVCLLPAA